MPIPQQSQPYPPTVPGQVSLTQPRPQSYLPAIEYMQSRQPLRRPTARMKFDPEVLKKLRSNGIFDALLNKAEPRIADMIKAYMALRHSYFNEQDNRALAYESPDAKKFLA